MLGGVGVSSFETYDAQRDARCGKKARQRGSGVDASSLA